ncbi:MAG: fumarylacetoacetate hydrolase family protein [Pigmentiphaga sp.]
MKFVTFEINGRQYPGVMLDDDTILNLASALEESSRTTSLLTLIQGGDSQLERVTDLLQHAKEDVLAAHCVPLASARLCSPIPEPRKNVFCVGRNYREHVSEAAKARGKEVKVPLHPQYFTKPPTAVIGPYDDFEWDEAVTRNLDYEVELGVVIGKTGRNIPREAALDHVFGYTVINDLTARELQRQHDQWFKGKGLDGSCPIGPWIVDAASVGNPQDLEVSLYVNGEQRQHARTDTMIFDVAEIISQLSLGMTLEPGDIIATGTPSGVGFAMEPPRLLGDGDLVEAEVSKIGRIANRIRRIPHRQAGQEG